LVNFTYTTVKYHTLRGIFYICCGLRGRTLAFSGYLYTIYASEPEHAHVAFIASLPAAAATHCHASLASFASFQISLAFWPIPLCWLLATPLLMFDMNIFASFCYFTSRHASDYSPAY
jgi:hypothetical protein